MARARSAQPTPCPDHSPPASEALTALRADPTLETARAVVTLFDAKCEGCAGPIHVDQATLINWLDARAGYDAVGDCLERVMFPKHNDHPATAE